MPDGQVPDGQVPDGQVIVRFEGLETSNGRGAGRLALGDQNSVVPAGVGPTAYTSVVMWCDRFDVSFGAVAWRRPRPEPGR